jgi:PAS domain S-box-containing protein
MWDIFTNPLDTSGFPARWNCGSWSAALGWLHVVSDVAVWMAYMAIPAILFYFASRRRDVPYRWMFLLFGAFVLACGTVHLVEATIFWWPVYRLSGLVKLATAIVSWATVLALIPIVPRALALRGPREFEREIAERRAIERALRESEEQYRELFENANDIVYLHDLEGRFTSANNAAIRATGYCREELLTMTVDDLVVPEYRALARDMTERKLTGDPGTSYELAIRTKDGKRRVVEVNSRLVLREGFPAQVQGIARDVTEQHQSKQLLAERAEQLALANMRTRRIIDSARNAFVAIDSRGKIIDWNPEAEATFGWSRDQVLGRELAATLIPTQFRDDHRRGLARFLETGRGPLMEQRVELTALRRDGQEFPIEVTISCVREGDSCFFYAFLYDITERKQAKEDLADRAAALTRSNAELEQFAYVASHDLQEPLRMVASYCQLLKRRYHGQLDKDADDFINFAVDGARRMQVLINDLLAYSRAGRKEPTLIRTDCCCVLDEAIMNLQASIEERRAAITHDPLPTILADRGQLVQVFQNLIGNAIKFCTGQPQIHVSAERLDDEWQFSIRDNGIGIATEHAQRIFEIFKRLHGWGQYPGTGIGLAICKKLVQRHGGRIWVESTTGQGSTFYFTVSAAGGTSS